MWLAITLTLILSSGVLVALLSLFRLGSLTEKYERSASATSDMQSRADALLHRFWSLRQTTERTQDDLAMIEHKLETMLEHKRALERESAEIFKRTHEQPIHNHNNSNSLGTERKNFETVSQMLKEREAWLEKERAEHQLKIKETEQHESTIRARLAELRHAQHLSATEMLHSLPLVFLSIQSPAAINSVVDKEFQRHVDFTAVLLVAIAGIWIFYVTFK